MSRNCHADRHVQQAFAIDGCLTDDAPIADVFAVWVERVADLNAAIDAHNARETGTRHVHVYRPSGCVNQWSWDHDDAECIAGMP